MSEWIKKDADNRKVFQRTFMSGSINDIDTMVNDFIALNDVVATTALFFDGIHIRVVFFKVK